MKKLALILTILISQTSLNVWAQTATLADLPQNCTSIDAGTQGRVIVLPGIHGEITKSEKLSISKLANIEYQSTDAVINLLNNFWPNYDKFVLNASLENNNSFAQYDSLKKFILKNRFSIPVALSINPDSPLSVKPQAFSNRAGEVMTNYSNINLSQLLRNLKNTGRYFPLIKSGQVFTWIINADQESETLFFQILDNARNLTLIFGISYQVQSKNCINYDMFEFSNQQPATRKKLQIETFGKFETPIYRESPIKDYFGPRIFGSDKVQLTENNNAAQVLNIGKVTPRHYLQAHLQYHNGIDIAIPKGTPVHAAQDGRVVLAGPVTCIGNDIVLEHNIGGHQIFTGYLHVSAFRKVIESPDGSLRFSSLDGPEELKPGEFLRRIAPGDFVRAGEIIALSGDGSVGRTKPVSVSFTSGRKVGCAMGEHLHFEMRLPRSNNASIEGVVPQQQFNSLSVKTDLVNPTDYVEYINYRCKKQKILEFNNWLHIEALNVDPLPVGPLTAWGCSENFENNILQNIPLANIPQVYRVSDDSTNREDQSHNQKREQSDKISQILRAFEK